MFEYVKDQGIIKTKNKQEQNKKQTKTKTENNNKKQNKCSLYVMKLRALSNYPHLQRHFYYGSF